MSELSTWQPGTGHYNGLMLAARGQLVHIAQDDHGILEVIDDHSTRSLYFGTTARQSSMSHDDPVQLVLTYTQSMLAGLLFLPQPREILIIGLGGGSLLRFLAHHYPEAGITVLEYRQSVIDIARDFFHLPESDRIQLVNRDGAEFIHATSDPRYDLILIDAFDATGVHPDVICPDFLHACRNRLQPQGVIALNLWNTDRAACRANIKAFESALNQRALRLPVDARNNLIVFGIPHLRKLPPKRELQNGVLDLKRRLGLDFPLMHRQLRRHNTLPLQWVLA